MILENKLALTGQIELAKELYDSKKIDKIVIGTFILLGILEKPLNDSQ